MNIKASDNEFPRLLWDSATSDDTAPAAGMISVYLKADGQLYGKNSADEEKLLIAATIGTPFAASAGDIIFALGYDPETGYQFANAPLTTLVGNNIITALGALTGFGPTKRLGTNSESELEWFDP